MVGRFLTQQAAGSRQQASYLRLDLSHIVTIAGTQNQQTPEHDDTQAGARARSARFRKPTGVCADPQGNLYISDVEQRKIYRVGGWDSRVSAIAGGGTAVVESNNDVATGKPFVTRLESAGLHTLDGVLLYFSDRFNNRIRMIVKPN